ncbi:MAG TPA: sugar phosphate nucleotidyltransferase [Candidatus Hydrogenedentes bacterium]|nr:sugar phosphate nucleotidyltransferase [Candidatus Hydrogenedentota bacterium]HPG69373.1 sugar phosphate nucleotidyltransferase [Candidatus Hydrogenedentota bacterium]
MAHGKYQGVILAAGHGSRMGPFGDAVPKPIAPICNKPLLVYQLEEMRRLGIEDVIVVIGHLGHRVTQHLGDGSAFGVHIRYVEQEKRLGLAHAVGQLERHIDRPFLLMLGDIFFDSAGLDPMFDVFEEKDASAVLAVRMETDPAIVQLSASVVLSEDGTVRRIIEKPRHVPSLLRCIGLYLFDSRIFDAIRRTPRTAMRDEYELTDSIQILVDYEYPVRTADVTDWAVNITYIGDLIDCCVHRLHQQGRTSLVGEACSIADGTRLVDTVLGPGAEIAHAMTLERCVVLPGVRIDQGDYYRETVFTSSGQFCAE